VVTVMAVDAGVLFGGLLVTEATFSVPGMGRLFLQALEAGDAPVVTAFVIVSAAFVIFFNLLADVLYAVLDPRVRLA
jgi:peptide/nickel transport system permease protein